MKKCAIVLCAALLLLSGCAKRSAGAVDDLIRISEEEAYQIACDYWDYTEGEVAPETGFVLFVVPDPAGALRTDPESGEAYYHYSLKWQVVGENGSTWMSTCDDVRIDARTGQCRYGT